MANNRMYLRCSHCPPADQDCRFLLAKYYPSEGWTSFIRGSRTFQTREELAQSKEADFESTVAEVVQNYQRLNAWFDRHRGCCGTRPETGFIIEYETSVPAV